MRDWNTFNARTNHMHTKIHKIYHGSDLGEATTFLLMVFFVPSHRACTQMSFCLGTPKLGVPKLRFLQFWEPFIFGPNPRLRWGLKQSCNPCQNIFNNMWQTTCAQVNQGDSPLLIVRSQIDNLIFNLSFNHNLYFKYSNGMCKPI
jgi:hypothetical protein